MLLKQKEMQLSVSWHCFLVILGLLAGSIKAASGMWSRKYQITVPMPSSNFVVVHTRKLRTIIRKFIIWEAEKEVRTLHCFSRGYEILKASIILIHFWFPDTKRLCDNL